jgi:hypothetical protein
VKLAMGAEAVSVDLRGPSSEADCLDSLAGLLVSIEHGLGMAQGHEHALAFYRLAAAQNDERGIRSVACLCVAA